MQPCIPCRPASVLWLCSCLTCSGSPHMQVTLQLPSEEEASSKQARQHTGLLHACGVASHAVSHSAVQVLNQPD